MNPDKYFVHTKDGIKIAVDHYKAQHLSLVIIAHGFYNSKNALLLKDLAKGLVDQHDVILFDFRGHGQSSGWFHWTSREYLDLLAVIEHVKGQYSKIGIVGFSLGAATTFITAAKTERINSIVAISCPQSFERIDYKFWNLSPAIDLKYSLLGEGRIGKGVRPGAFWRVKEKPIHLVATIKQPVLFIHGTKDWVINHRHTHALYEKTRAFKKLEIIDDGPHAEYLIMKHKDRLLALILSWFDETMLKK